MSRPDTAPSSPPQGLPGGAGSPALRILIAGGGTGGHLFPGFAIAEALQARVPGCEVRFAGSAYGIEHRAVPQRGYRLHRIAVRGLYGVPWPRRLLRLALLPWAFLQCLWVLLAYRPHLVVGVGGYASGPVLATALLLRRRCVLHEQNAWPGLTNRLLGRFVAAAFVTVEDQPGFFRHPVLAGMPVRAAIRALRPPAPEASPTRRTQPLLFVFGGSQGARAINRAMVAALPHLKSRHPHLRILHQTGPADLADVSHAYAQTGLSAEVVPFLEDMAQAYRSARLIVSRAGASAVNEIIVARRAALLIPIPGTSGDHQRRNALHAAGAGAAEVLEQADLTGAVLAERIGALMADAARLDAMEAATDALDPGDAAGRIADACLRLLAD